tara:strand:+ start:2236 stop:2385 length:150 start_codon:yes stop_codon:yes gene_type:complete
MSKSTDSKKTESKKRFNKLSDRLTRNLYPDDDDEKAGLGEGDKKTGKEI